MDSIDTKVKKSHPLEHPPAAPAAGLGLMAAPYLFALGEGALITATAAGLISMGVGVTYALATNALIKPPNQRINGMSGTSGRPVGAANVVRNQARPNGPAQFVLGKMHIYPPLAAVPYIEQAGSDTWVRLLLHVGDGDYDISEIKIGETAITAYSGDYETADGYIADAAIQGIYPNDVATEGTLPVEVTNASGGLIKTTAADTSEISVDVGCPNGLNKVYDSGRFRGDSVTYTLRYRVNSPQGSWVNFSGSPFGREAKTTSLVAWNHRVTGLSPDTYDVELVKTKTDYPPADSGKISRVNTFYWMGMNSIKTGSDAVTDDNAYLLAIRIKLTGNFSGNIDTVNCIAERKLPAWTGSAWGSAAVTRNPAWAFASILRGTASGEPLVADAKIDGDALLTWATNCTANGFNFDAVIDSETTAKQLLEQIASVGRASRAIPSGLHTVIEDVAQGSNKAHFSPRNSGDFSGHRDFLDYPHAFKVRYIEPAAGYQIEEIIICDDGYYESVPSSTTWAATTAYSLDDYVVPTTPNGYYYKCTAAGTSDSGEPTTWPTTPRDTVIDAGATWMCHDIATDFEAMEFLGVTDADHAWKLARYHIAVARLRSETFTVNVDAENLRNTRGDRVGLTHDVVMVGLGQARIKSIAGSDVTMDDSITMEGGKTYGTIVRKADGTFLSTSITLDIGEQTIVTMGSVIGIAAGDLMFFGETAAISQDCIVKSIDYGPDLSAKVTLTNYDAAIYTADSGTIPTYTPVISDPPAVNRVPPTPIIEGIATGFFTRNPVDVGDLPLEVSIDFGIAMSHYIEPAYFQAQYRSYDDEDGGDIYSPWQYAPDVPLEARRVIITVQDGSFYDFRVRAVSQYGITGAWATESDYEISFTGPTPPDISGQALVQGGSTYKGSDIEIEWTPAPDAWLVSKYKVVVYETSDLNTPLRTITKEFIDAFFSYTHQMNIEDNAGIPTSAITFRVWAVNHVGDLSDNYATLAVSAAASDPPGGLALVQGGSSFPGPDVALSWTADSDPYWVKKYKIETYKTAGSVLLRTEYRDVDDAFYTYSFAMNSEDNSGTPITGLTFKVYSISMFNVISATSSDKAVTNAVPPNVSGVTATGRMGGVEFEWTANTESDFSRYKYRILVEGGDYSNYFETNDIRTSRTLTTSEKSASGYDANILIQIWAVDVFGQTSPTGASDNADCLGLAVEVSDVEDYTLTPSKFDIPLPLVDGLTITNNSPSAGYVAWTSFNLYLSGTLYSISSGNSNNEFICFKDLSTTLTEIDTHPSENYGDWDPAEDFLIIWNNGGVGKKAWSTFINLVASSGFIGALAVLEANIGALAVTNAKINDLNATKINAGFLNADRIQSTSIIVSKLASDATNLMFASSTRDFADVGGTTKPANNADVTSANPQNGAWLTDGGNLVTKNEAEVNALNLTNGPAQANADVTSTKTAADAAAYTGASISTSYTAAKNTNPLADQTSVNTAANITGQGALATQSSVNLASAEVTNKTADNISETVSKFWAVEANADQTSGNQAASISGQGSLATQNDVAVGDLQSGITDRMFIDSTTKANIENWRAGGDVTKIDGGDIFADSIVASAIYGAGFGTLTITSGKIVINTTDALEIGGSGNINVLDGGDIILQGDNTSPSLIQWKNGATVIDNLAARISGTYLATGFWPEIINTRSFVVGWDVINDALKPYNSINLFSSLYWQMQAYVDASNWSIIIGNTTLGSVEMDINYGGTQYKIEFSQGGGWHFAPNTTNVIDLGETGGRWKNFFLSGYAQIIDYLAAEGGIHVGGTSDPGTDNLLVDGNITVVDYLAASGGIHVGGTSDPGTDNLLVDGDITVGEDSWIGIGSGLERIVFNGGSGQIEIYGANLVVDDNITSDVLTVINGDGFRIANGSTPGSQTASGTQGQIAWDLTYLYVCTQTNYWRRITFPVW